MLPALSRIPLNSHCRSTNSTKMAHATHKVRPKAGSRLQQCPTQRLPFIPPDTPISISPPPECISFVTNNLAAWLLTLATPVDSATYPFANAEAFLFQWPSGFNALPIFLLTYLNFSKSDLQEVQVTVSTICTIEYDAHSHSNSTLTSPLALRRTVESRVPVYVALRIECGESVGESAFWGDIEE